MNLLRPLTLAAALGLSLPTFAQQTTTPTPAPPPGTVPITSQTPVTPGQDPTTPTAAPPTKKERKTQRKSQKASRTTSAKPAGAASEKTTPPQ